MSSPLVEELRQQAPWLVDDLGFRVTHHEYDDRHFGNSVVVLDSDTMRVRFIRDRDRIETDVASRSEPEAWMSLGFLWFSITGDRPEPALRGWTLFLREHLSELGDALGARFPQTKYRFDQAQQQSRNVLQEQLARYPISPVGRLRLFARTPLGTIVMGPMGWVIACVLIVYLMIKR